MISEDMHDCVANLAQVENADSKQGIVRHLSDITHGDGVHPRARNCFTNLKDSEGEQCFATPHKCLVKAAPNINVYTDGSWLNPLKQYLGLGGAGVWWPNRCIHDSPSNPIAYRNRISSAECDLAHYRQQEGGLQLFTKIGGFGGNSTRTEVAAGIIAICANGPVHIGSDSRAFVDKANSLLELLVVGKDPGDKRPRALANDGDLWAHFCCAVKAKSPGSIRISWVKGHADQKHIDAGLTTATDLVGNHKADATADEATALYGTDMLDVARWDHDRAKAIKHS